MTEHIIKHEAMKTCFTFRIVEPDKALAARVASACIAQIESLESKLSRYYPGSDIHRINQLSAGESLFLSDETYECLRIAFDVYQETGGYFDITLGRKIEHIKSKEPGALPCLEGQLMLDPNRPEIHCVEAGRELDLGGIGKGFALDKVKEAMEETGIESALLSAGASTHLAFGEKTWAIELTGCQERDSYQLHKEAISASGTDIQGCHLISPFNEDETYHATRLWVVESTGAQADAWSTAAMLLPKDALKAAREQRHIFTL